MFGGLYGDLPAAKDAGETPETKPSWTAGLAAQLKPAPRKPAVHGPLPAALRAGHARPTPPPRPAAASAAAVATVTTVSPAPAPASAAGPSLSAAVADEYEPARPNSYDEAARQRALKRKQEELEEKRRALERQRQVRTGRVSAALRGGLTRVTRRSLQRGASRPCRRRRSNMRICRCPRRRRCRRRCNSSTFRRRRRCRRRCRRSLRSPHLSAA